MRAQGQYPYTKRGAQSGGDGERGVANVNAKIFMRLTFLCMTWLGLAWLGLTIILLFPLSLSLFLFFFTMLEGWPRGNSASGAGCWVGVV